MMNPKSEVTAIVAAYNEAPTIGAVVKTLADSECFRDVIVISDGSTDRTAAIAKASGASLVHQFPWKHGKGAAMQHGVTHCDTPLLFFCDADLLGLKKEHLEILIAPVMKGELDMCVCLSDRGKFLTWIEYVLPLVGGQRAMRREIFESVPDKYLQGYMVETALNAYCRIHRLRVGRRPLPGLHFRHKTDKVGFTQGLKEYVGMWKMVLKAHLMLWVARLSGEWQP